MPSHNIYLVGHRGARREAPENTLAGFSHLRSLDIHFVELDVHLSRDHELICIHDATLKRTTGKKGSIKQFLHSDLRQIPANREWPKWSEGDIKIPLLKDILSEWPAIEHIQIEVKPPKRYFCSLIAKKLQEIIDQYQLHHKAVITSQSHYFLKMSKAMMNPTIHHGWVVQHRFPLLLTLAKKAGFSYLIANHKMLDDAFIQECHAMNLKISAWTVNDIESAQKLIDMGVDSIITDYPSEFKTHFNKKFSNICSRPLKTV